MDAVPSMLEYIVRGAASAVLPMNLLVMFIGLVVGIVGGMLPGITTVTAVALFVPFTFSMPPDMALIGLGGVFCGAMYGGPNAAILINTPGTPGSIATSLDGYPLVMQGRAEEACYIALIASVLGGIFGTVVLMLFFEPLSVMALKFGFSGWDCSACPRWRRCSPAISPRGCSAEPSGWPCARWALTL